MWDGWQSKCPRLLRLLVGERKRRNVVTKSRIPRGFPLLLAHPMQDAVVNRLVAAQVKRILPGRLRVPCVASPLKSRTEIIRDRSLCGIVPCGRHRVWAHTPGGPIRGCAQGPLAALPLTADRQTSHVSRWPRQWRVRLDSQLASVWRAALPDISVDGNGNCPNYCNSCARNTNTGILFVVLHLQMRTRQSTP
jgi:hypothetical protein